MAPRFLNTAAERDPGNKAADSAHVMGSGGLAVDAMAIGCLGVERRVELFFSYLALDFGHFSHSLRT